MQQRPALLKLLNMKGPKKYSIGIDLGGTKVEAALIDSDGGIHARNRLEVGAIHGLNHVLKQVDLVVKNALKQLPTGQKISGIGMGMPGVYLKSENRVYGSPHTSLYQMPGFVEALENKLDSSLIVENDANCLALSEYWVYTKENPEQAVQNVLAVILGTGVGSGIIFNGKLLSNAYARGMEFGHIPVDNLNPRTCECKAFGCLEAYLSGPSLGRRYFELSQKKIETQNLESLADSGDSFAQKILKDSVEYLVQGLRTAVNLLGTELVILGGGVSRMKYWYPRLENALNSRHNLFGVASVKRVPVIAARLGDSSGVLGAGLLAVT